MGQESPPFRRPGPTPQTEDDFELQRIIELLLDNTGQTQTGDSAGRTIPFPFPKSFQTGGTVIKAGFGLDFCLAPANGIFSDICIIAKFRKPKIVIE